MRWISNLPKSVAILTREARDRIAPPPFAGTRVGGGIHVDQPESWDGAGDVPIGWTGLPGEKDLGGGVWACAYPVELDALDKTSLTVGDKALLDTKLATTADLMADGAPVPVVEIAVAEEAK